MSKIRVVKRRKNHFYPFLPLYWQMVWIYLHLQTAYNPLISLSRKKSRATEAHNEIKMLRSVFGYYANLPFLWSDI